MRRDQKRRGEGEQFRRPNAMTRYIPGTRVYGRMSTVLSPLLSLSLSLSTNLHDYYLLPSPLCISGNRARNGNLIPASFHSIARTSIEWLDIDRVGDISVKRDQGKTAIRPSFIVGSSVRLTCREIVRYIYRIKLILYVIFYIEDKNTSCTNFNLFVRTNLIVTLVCWKK